MKTLFSLSIGLCAVLCNGGAFAQAVDMSPVPDTTSILGLKYSRASYKTTWFGEGPSGASGVYHLYGRFPMKNDWHFNADLPFIVATQASASENGLGNIYIGFQKVMTANRNSNMELGLYLPTIGSNNFLRQEVGVASDPYGVFQYAEGITASFNIVYENARKKDFLSGVEAGPDIFIPTYEGGSVNLFVHGAAKGGYNFSGFALWTELSGILPVNLDGGFTEEVISKVVVGGQLTRPKFRIGAFYGIPLGSSQREFIGDIFDITLEFEIGD